MAQNEHPPPDPGETEPELLRIPRVAEILGVSRATLYRLIDDGRIRTIDLRGTRRVARREIDRFLAGRS